MLADEKERWVKESEELIKKDMFLKREDVLYLRAIRILEEGVKRTKDQEIEYRQWISAYEVTTREKYIKGTASELLKRIKKEIYYKAE